MDAGRYDELPPRVDLDDTVQEVPHHEAVDEVQGVRRVSPLSPIAGIDEARLYASIATSTRVEPWRRRAARFMALVALCGAVLAAVFGR